MKRNCIIILLLILTSKVFGVSFPEYPLLIMIEKSEFIIHGHVIDVYETDSITKQELRKLSREKKFCWSGLSTETAKIKVISKKKGLLQHDTIYVPFHYNAYLALPKFEKNDTLLLFLNSFDKKGYYGKADPRFGFKSENIDLYFQSIESYLKIPAQPDSISKSLKFNWLIDLACSPELTREGSFVLKEFKNESFSQSIKTRLTESLISRKKVQTKDLYLLELVSRFGLNIEAIEYCVRNLESSLEDELYYVTALDLMQAINEMNNHRKYKRLIDKYFNTFDLRKDKKIKQLEIIQEFIIQVRKH